MCGANQKDEKNEENVETWSRIKVNIFPHSLQFTQNVSVLLHLTEDTHFCVEKEPLYF